MLDTVLVWLFGLAPSNPGLQEQNNQPRYGQYHFALGVGVLASLARAPWSLLQWAGVPGGAQ